MDESAALKAGVAAAREAQRKRTQLLLQAKKKEKANIAGQNEREQQSGETPPQSDRNRTALVPPPRKGRCRACWAVLVTYDQGSEIYGWLLFKIARAPIIIVAGLFLAQQIIRSAEAEGERRGDGRVMGGAFAR